MKFTFRNYGLSIVLLVAFVAFWVAQALVGHRQCNEQRDGHHLPPLAMADYLRSSHFWEATSENWESEFLQMAAYVWLTVFLFQKGSSESKDPDSPSPQDKDPRLERDKPDAPWPVRRGGWVLKLYENSLGLAFAALFIASMLIHSAAGARLHSEEQVAMGKPAVSWLGYFATEQFWFESLQNWQSEFLAIAAMVVLSIFLRQRGSPESKPVAAAIDQTGDED